MLTFIQFLREMGELPGREPMCNRYAEQKNAQVRRKEIFKAIQERASDVAHAADSSASERQIAEISRLIAEMMSSE